MTDATTVVDLGPTLTFLANTAITVLTPFVVYALHRLGRKLGIDTAQLQLDKAVEQAAEIGRAKLITQLGHADFTRFDTHDTASAAAIEYALAVAGGAVRKIGLSQDSLSALVTGKLAQLDPTIVAPPVEPVPPRTCP